MSGLWVGEALVHKDGTVARVWSIREPRLMPVFPLFTQSIVDAVARWEYEPWLHNGRATPFCVTITMDIDF